MHLLLRCELYAILVAVVLVVFVVILSVVLVVTFLCVCRNYHAQRNRRYHYNAGCPSNEHVAYINTHNLCYNNVVAYTCHSQSLIIIIISDRRYIPQ